MKRLLQITIVVGLWVGFCSIGLGQAFESFFDGPLAENVQSEVWNPNLVESIGVMAIGDGRMTTSVYGGWVFPANDQNLSYWYPSTALDTGGAFGVSSGRRFNPRWRSELDFTFRRNLPEMYSFPYFTALTASSLFYLSPQLEGNFDTYSVMWNVYYEFDRERNQFLVPYAGFGVGLAYFDTDLSWGGVGDTVSNESAFAFQTIAGVSAKLLRRLEFFTEYRFFYSTEVDFIFPEQVTSFYTFPEFQASYKSTTSNLFMGLRLTY